MNIFQDGDFDEDFFKDLDDEELITQIDKNIVENPKSQKRNTEISSNDQILTATNIITSNSSGKNSSSDVPKSNKPLVSCSPTLTYISSSHFDLRKTGFQTSTQKTKAQDADTNTQAFSLNRGISLLLDDSQEIEETISKNNIVGQPVNIKNKVLQIFDNAEDEPQKNKENNFQKSSSILQSSFNNFGQQNNFRQINKERTNKLLEVFNNPINEEPTVEVNNEESENALKRKKHVAFTETESEASKAKKVCQLDNTTEIQKTKKCVSFAPTEIAVADNCNKSKKFTIERPKLPQQKQAVTRKFPGPAGILPDDINESEVVQIPDTCDENDNNKKDSNKKELNNLCSQTTKKLFTSGAWQRMMDDLPADFNLIDLETVKQNAGNISKEYKKIPYLAAVIHQIDFKINDPHIILKDLTGTIDARLHHSILKNYPNTLRCGLVILVKDVGLIVTKKNHICVIISKNNLVSLYSETDSLIETSLLKELLEKSNITNNPLETDCEELFAEDFDA